MQRIPTVYGFSIIILVIILMILNHFIYIAILERTDVHGVVYEKPAGGGLVE
jgi:hypothetical protein